MTLYQHIIIWQANRIYKRAIKKLARDVEQRKQTVSQYPKHREASLRGWETRRSRRTV